MTDTKAPTPASRSAKPRAKPAPVQRLGTKQARAVKVQHVQDVAAPPRPARRRDVESGQSQVLYVRSKGVDDFVTRVYAADPIGLIETERMGVAGVFVKDLSKRMNIPAQRMFTMLGVPKATAEKKVASGELLSGSGGRAAIGMARLLGIAQEIVEGSTAREAKDFDAAKWLGQWLERPQPALGGRKPASLIDTPTGVDVVARLLGAIESGAYQ
jgi:putative toxin-antitoxin system antitoxin component (TIGR02293 family)